MGVTIETETPMQPDVEAMIAELNEALLALTPREYCHHLTAEQMNSPRTTLFLAREDGAALGCGALHRHDDGVVEVKRMYTRPAARGRKIGAQILDEILALAKKEGAREIVLETGNNFDAALHLYAKAGFEECGPVLDYPPTPATSFYRMSLKEHTGA